MLFFSPFFPIPYSGLWEHSHIKSRLKPHSPAKRKLSQSMPVGFQDIKTFPCVFAPSKQDSHRTTRNWLEAEILCPRRAAWGWALTQGSGGAPCCVCVARRKAVMAQVFSDHLVFLTCWN
jgi:hypothetical protein